jgi:hypothetical protein
MLLPAGARSFSSNSVRAAALAVNFQEVVHSALAVKADVAKRQ